MNTVPNQSATPIRGVRVPDDLWKRAQERAKAEGRSVSDVVREALSEYVEESE